MTNHPHRRDDEAVEPSGEELAAHLEPAGPGGIPPQGSAEIPAHTTNGVPPGLKPGNAAKLAAEAVAETLGQHLPQMLFQAFAAALQQVPVQAVIQQHVCCTCIINRIGWENAHRSEMEKAMEDAAHAAGVQPGTPQAAQLDLAVFLPEHLRPGGRAGMPDVRQAVTTFGGTEVCPMHIPGVQAGGSQLIRATAAMSPAMLGQLAGIR